LIAEQTAEGGEEADLGALEEVEDEGEELGALENLLRVQVEAPEMWGDMGRSGEIWICEYRWRHPPPGERLRARLRAGSGAVQSRRQARGSAARTGGALEQARSTSRHISADLGASRLI